MENLGLYVAEFLGTLILILCGDGVVANVLLKKSKGEGGGWIVITAGWAFGVAVAVYVTGWVSGAHINPAVTIAMAVMGKISWFIVPGYIISQMIGAFCGAILVYLAYKDHFKETDNPDAKLSIFCTVPAIRNPISNIITEIIGSSLLLIGVLGIIDEHNHVGALGALLLGLLVFAIGLSLGGPTGYAINPARDLGPRIAHCLLPIPGKRDSDWKYAPIPVTAPIIGAIIGVIIYTMCLKLWIP
ncbi:MAG TPA: MIP/aquaporin family protein [Candidatus Eremiobacteraeota bacterium]|nr:MAG: Glycerol uptake facilitator protein [bacterium ADurb.Bin363]HPZ10418.1 MIP/aquaporin family protein [Candidatus Eremiobacteraeota bacterium]